MILDVDSFLRFAWLLLNAIFNVALTYMISHILNPMFIFGYIGKVCRAYSQF